VDIESIYVAGVSPGHKRNSNGHTYGAGTTKNEGRKLSYGNVLKRGIILDKQLPFARK
jgi:hypothetical protein